MNNKFLINALVGKGSCLLSTSCFKFNFEYLSVIDDLNKIYNSYQNSNSLIKVHLCDDSATIYLNSEAYLLNCILDDEDLVDHKSIIRVLDNYNLDSLTKEILLETIMIKKPLNLMNLIENHFASPNQRFFIDLRDFEDNEQKLEVIV